MDKIAYVNQILEPIVIWIRYNPSSIVTIAFALTVLVEGYFLMKKRLGKK